MPPISIRPWLRCKSAQHDTLEQLLALQAQHPGCIHACTDITGFGLLGHLNEMGAASDPVTIELWIEEIPLLQGASALLDAGIASTLAPANRRALASLGSQVRAIKAGRDQSNSLNPCFGNDVDRPANLRAPVDQR